MIPAVVTDPASGQPVVVASLERQRVAMEKSVQDACSEFLSGADWEKNMAIVDQLNRSPYLCPFAIAEIRKQLKTKNPEIEILALQLVETIIKNCPSSHAAVAQEDFLRYLVKVGTNQRQGGKFTQFKTKLSKKNTSINSQQLRSQCIEKALLILKMLAIAYEESNLYPVFKQTYKSLKAQKVRFPETNKDESLNIFSPMHSSAAPDEFGSGASGQPTAMGSIQNPDMPMIRPVVPIESVTDATLVGAQESAQVLFTMINAPILSFDIIPDLTAMLNQTQQQIVVMISEGNAPESVLMQALQVNDIVNQVLEDAQAILNGTKRRYQEEVDVQKMMERQHSEDSDGKDPNQEEPSLEHSISLQEDQHNGGDDLLALSGPKSNPASKKRRGSKKENRQSIDLLGIADLTEKKEPPKKKESEDDLMGFLGIDNNAAAKQPEPVKPTVFDPLEENAPPPAFTGAAYGNNNTNVYNHNNNNGNHMAANNNGNYMMSNYNNNNMNGNMNVNMNGGTPQHPAKLNPVDRGNNSVLNVLTGEPSPSQSYPSSSEPSAQSSPSKPTQAQPPEKKILKPAAAANNNNNGNDPFADMGDPFADMAAPSFDDIMKPKQENNNNNVPSPQPQPQIQPVQQPKPKPKPKPQPQPQPLQQMPVKPPQPKKVDSNAIILDMFASGGGADASTSASNGQKAQPAKPKEADNPFDALANPFGGDDANEKDNNTANPFDTLDNPFASDADILGGSAGDLDPNNPFAATPVQNTKKQDDFMGDRDPFADM
eukprot:CAMPEP_0197025436 /NCGR_PEP_ID=MMETSP1384-20130603/5775_1 /TAXON_ID=29189 /ORGANISM="Ammonia sp." /LENGTH=769 /DNA_ID=CAMNT_0042453965 /DNA_START=547 /DNA_END=2856 /DNA_ORIENTATION=-